MYFSRDAHLWKFVDHKPNATVYTLHVKMTFSLSLSLFSRFFFFTSSFQRLNSIQDFITIFPYVTTISYTYIWKPIHSMTDIIELTLFSLTASTLFMWTFFPLFFLFLFYRFYREDVDFNFTWIMSEWFTKYCRLFNERQSGMRKKKESFNVIFSFSPFPCYVCFLLFDSLSVSPFFFIFFFFFNCAKSQKENLICLLLVWQSFLANETKYSRSFPAMTHKMIILHIFLNLNGIDIKSNALNLMILKTCCYESIG